MHILGITVVLVFVLHAADRSHADHGSDRSPQDLEQRLRSASTVDELMSLMYPSFWAELKCRSKLMAAGSGSRLQFQTQSQTQTQTQRSRPRSWTEEPIYAAAYLNLDMLKTIESEWRKTQCSPREVCVDVAREFGTPTNLFYKPPCVSVSRCGGCCSSEDKHCRNISTAYVSKTLFEITVPITQGTKPVTISVANHTQCSCLSKLDMFKQVHSIIRRALPECPAANRTCPRAQTWSSRLCRCVSSGAYHNPAPPQNARPTQLNDFLSSDVCGANRELDPASCQCVCSAPSGQSCPLHFSWDPASCQCVCSAPSGQSCPLHFSWDPASCQCVCSAPSGQSCPLHFSWDPASCQCVCSAPSGQSCPLHFSWDPASCQCVCSAPSGQSCPLHFSWDPTSCQCVCSAPSGQSCPLHFSWDPASCQCVCSAPSGQSCPLHFSWDPASCQCVCSKSCPRHQPLNTVRCLCECSESPNKCFLRGRRFYPALCSCVRAPCEVRRRRCELGFVFSEEVCRCIPSHWRRLD